MPNGAARGNCAAGNPAVAVNDAVYGYGVIIRLLLPKKSVRFEPSAYYNVFSIQFHLDSGYQLLYISTGAKVKVTY